MRLASDKGGRGVNVFGSKKTFQESNYCRKTSTECFQKRSRRFTVFNNKKLDLSKFKDPSMSTTKQPKCDDSKFSDLDSDFTSISQVQRSHVSPRDSNNRSKQRSEQERSEHSKSVFTNVREGSYHSYDGNDSALSVSTQEQESDESFLTKVYREKHKYEFINPKEYLASHSRALRLFNKNGKPLTDRMGRPLVDILGNLLVVLDNNGRVISDLKGNQVFNSLGESAIYSNTNLHIPPSEGEPGIPLLDVDKKHILFLYDSKGHPLTDSLGRPLLKASGSLMIGISSRDNINIENNKDNQLKNLFAKAPLENFVRRVQIFTSSLQPLTDESGRPLEGAVIICNKNGMPMCDKDGGALVFKYGSRIITPQVKQTEEIDNSQTKTPTQTSEDSIKETHVDNYKLKTQSGADYETQLEELNSLIREDGSNAHINCKNKITETQDKIINIIVDDKNVIKDENEWSKCFGKVPNLGNKNGPEVVSDDLSMPKDNKIYDDTVNVKPTDLKVYNYVIKTQNVEQKNPIKNCFKSAGASENNIIGKMCKDTLLNSKITQKKVDFNEIGTCISKEAIVLFDASRKLETQKSTINTVAFKTIKGGGISHCVMRRKSKKKMYTSNFIQYFKNALNLTSLKQNDNRLIYNDYGKPMKDIYGNFLYDKFGIPLTGAHGRNLGEKARHTLRLRLRNIPIVPVNNAKVSDGKMIRALTNNASHDQLGDPFYDKFGRPLYDLFGKLIYDNCGRPLTDAYGRPLIDAIGQPLMDSEGNVLTAVANSPGNSGLTDIFGRRQYDRRGRPLFDSYGRPRFDIFTNAIYDSCGRPAIDGNGNTLFDFLNKPIQPHPEKPLYKNARALLPRYIDRILAMPSMHHVLKFSRASLKDVFGGPLFDDFGRPLYNKFGKPFYDKYGRPLYDKDGRPLCDCYGRPLSEEIRQSPDDQTLSVVDSLKLLKLTKESSKWMEIKRSQLQSIKSIYSGILDDAIIMKVVQPSKNKSTQYTYALTRVTRFSSGRQALEILEAPLSPATASDMHHLPVDNKPLIMMARRRQRIVKQNRTAKNH